MRKGHKRNGRCTPGFLLVVFGVTLLSLPVLSPTAAHAAHGLAASPTASTSSFVPPWLSSALSSLTTLLTAFVTLFLAVVGVIVGGLVGWRLIALTLRRLGHRLLVLTDFVNASGDADTDKILIGLSARAREMLEHDMERLRADAKENAEQTDAELHRSPLPQSTNLDNVGLMASAIAGVTSGNVSAIVNLLNILFAPKGAKVTTTLQKDENDPALVGMTFVIGEVTGGDDTSHTFWEAQIPPSAGTGDEREPPKTVPARYVSLLDPALRQLSIELARRELMRQRSFRYRNLPAIPFLPLEWGKQRNLAKLYNYVGRQYQVAGMQLGSPYDATFYRCSIEEYGKAIDRDDSWYRPHENLADTYTLLAHRTRLLGGEQETAEATRYYRRALDHYDMALSRLEAEGSSSSRGRSTNVGQGTDHPRQSTVRPSRNISATVVHRWRIQLGKAKAMLPTVRYHLDNLDDETTRVIEEVREKWHLQAKPDGRVLYNLAACYAVADKMDAPGPELIMDAQRYLVCAVVLQWSLIGQAQYDPHFTGCWTDYELFRSRLQRDRKRFRSMLPDDFTRFEEMLACLLTELMAGERKDESVLSGTGGVAGRSPTSSHT